jgi:hypothetical protein
MYPASREWTARFDIDAICLHTSASSRNQKAGWVEDCSIDVAIDKKTGKPEAIITCLEADPHRPQGTSGMRPSSCQAFDPSERRQKSFGITAGYCRSLHLI